jgi:hypothetical protein
MVMPKVWPTKDHVESIILSASYLSMAWEVVFHCDALECFGKEK